GADIGVMYLSDGEAAEGEAQRANDGAKPPQPDGAAEEIEEDLALKEANGTQPDEGCIDRQKQEQEEMQRIEGTSLAIGKDGIATEELGRPEGQQPLLERRAKASEDGVVEDARVVLIRNLAGGD